MKKNGFTLAEVLITLTIIGVIAAITIPNLMQNWRKHERITQIRSAQSILTNAFKMAINENGEYEDLNWDYTKGTYSTIAFVNHMKPYLKIQKECGYSKNAGCFLNTKLWYWMNGSSADNFTTVYYKIKLENGMDVGFRSAPNGKTASIVVDVNGAHGPTKLGVDVFWFEADMNSGKGFIIAGGTNNYNYKNYKEAMTDGNGQCNTTSSNSGTACTRLLELNHWEFPDDYPIKKF